MGRLHFPATLGAMRWQLRSLAALVSIRIDRMFGGGIGQAANHKVGRRINLTLGSSRAADSTGRFEITRH